MSDEKPIMVRCRSWRTCKAVTCKHRKQHEAFQVVPHAQHTCADVPPGTAESMCAPVKGRPKELSDDVYRQGVVTPKSQTEKVP